MKISPEISVLQPGSDFSETTTRCESLIQNAVYKFCPPPAGSDVHDLRQAAMMGLWRATEKYNPETSENFEGFAWRAMCRSLIDHHRSANSQANQVLNLAAAIDAPLTESGSTMHSVIPNSKISSPLDALLFKEWIGTFAEAFSDLPEKGRQAYKMMCFEGLSTKETTTMIGGTGMEAKGVLQYARRRLRETVDSPFVEY